MVSPFELRRRNSWLQCTRCNRCQFPFGFFVNDSQMAPNHTSFGYLSHRSFIAAIVRSSSLLIRVLASQNRVAKKLAYNQVGVSRVSTRPLATTPTITKYKVDEMKGVFNLIVSKFQRRYCQEGGPEGPGFDSQMGALSEFFSRCFHFRHAEIPSLNTH